MGSTDDVDHEARAWVCGPGSSRSWMLVRPIPAPPPPRSACLDRPASVWLLASSDHERAVPEPRLVPDLLLDHRTDHRTVPAEHCGLASISSTRFSALLYYGEHWPAGGHLAARVRPGRRCREHILGSIQNCCVAGCLNTLTERWSCSGWTA